MKTISFAARALVLGGALSAGCALGPTYSRPTVAMPTTWKESEVALTRSAIEVALPSAWWTIFNDPDLTALEDQVVAANQDLQRAAARVKEARALARISEAESYPNVALSASQSRFRTSANRRSATGTPHPSFQARDHVAQFELGYELDFWGRIRNANDAARADAASVAEDYQVVLLALTADAARHYYQLRTLDAEKRILDASLELRRDAVRLQQTRSQAGLINEVDVSRAQIELANLEAEDYAVTRQRARIEHALAVLCGRSPSGFTVARSVAAFPLPEIPAGLPSSLLERRPDLAAAEHQLEAAGARIGVAKAEFFPQFSLTGAAGFASGDLSSLLQGDSRLWSFGPSVHLPIFQGGRNRANLAAAQARYDQSIAAYRSTVLNAFREVEDTLAELNTLTAQEDAAHRAWLAARDTAALAAERYQKGLSSYLDVVDAQRSALVAERLTTQLRGERTISTILLAKALGGGWQRAASPSLVQR